MDIMARQKPGRRSPRGITLVEVLFAMLLLTVGVFGLLSVFAGSTRQLGLARRQTVVASYAQRRLDSLAALPCATLAGNPSGTRRTFETLSDTWSVSGSGSAPTLRVNITTPDVDTALVFTSAVPCR